MCGLVGLWSKRNKPVGQQVFELYSRQKKRGTDGFGFLEIDKDWKLVGVHRSTYEDGIKKLLMKSKASTILFHHRFPTSTPNTLGTTHPMFVSHDELEHDYYFAHNGGISNKIFLHNQHKELGYKYQTEYREKKIAVHSDGTEEVLSMDEPQFNDSEAFAIEMARYMDDITDKVNTYGPVAFWGVRLKKGTNEVLSLYYGHNHGRELSRVGHKKYEGIMSEGKHEVGEMKVYSYDKGDKQLYEQELNIDECRPVKTTLWSSKTGVLEMKYYTWSEAFDTGYSITYSFFKVLHDGVTYYIPEKFKKEFNNNEIEPPKTVGFQEVRKPQKNLMTLPSGGNDDAKKSLEEFAMRLAKLYQEETKLDSSYDMGYLTEPQYDTQSREIAIRIEAMEDAINSLGLDDDEVEEMIELCKDMENYNVSYKVIQ